MRKKIFLVSMICFVIVGSIYSISFTDVLKERYRLDKKILEEYLQRNNLQKRSSIESERTWELVYLRNGAPIYYITNNANAAATVSTNAIYNGGSLGLNLSGSGMTVGEWDGGGVRTSHQEFGGRVTQKDSPSGNNYHATHVAGTLIASGVNAAAKGMAFAANLDAYDWTDDDTEISTAAGNGLLISNHSYGVVSGWAEGNWSGSSGFHWFGLSGDQEDYKFGFYSSSAQNWDQIAYNNDNYLIVKSAGNDRNDSGPTDGTTYYRYNSSGEWVSGTMDVNGPYDDYYDGGFDTIPFKGNAKNILTVGSIADIAGGYSAYTDVNVSSFSGWGPTDDGRIKPDIVGNGEAVTSTYTGADDNYAALSGTSMSSPNVTGSLVLLQEYYNDLNSAYMKAATLKGLVLHTADEADNNSGPDYKHGWGLLNTGTAAEVLQNNNENHIVDELTLNNGDTYSLDVFANSEEPLKITICWTDKAGTVPTAEVDPTNQILVNDLDLRVVDSSDNSNFPWILDPNNPANPPTTGDNSRDNVEMVYISTPVHDVYTIEVDHKGTLSSPSYQNFSLIVSGITNDPDPAVVVAPADGSIGASVFPVLRWSNNSPLLPDGYKIHLGTDGGGIAAPTSILAGVDLGNVTEYSVEDVLDEGTTYYWQIIPYTNSRGGSRGDAENCPIWSFTTENAEVVDQPSDNNDEPQNFDFDGGSGSSGSTVIIDPPDDEADNGNLTITQYDSAPENLPNPENALNIAYQIDGSSYTGGYPVTVTFEWNSPAPNGSTPEIVYWDDTSNEWVSDSQDSGVSIISADLSDSAPYSITFTTDHFSNWAISKGEDSTLPITLSSFTAELVGDNANIAWETASETNLLGFNLKKSTNDVLGEAYQINPEVIEAVGNSSQGSLYSFEDSSIEEEIEYYYWLEVVNLDSSIDYYGPIFFINEEDDEEEIPDIKLTTIESIYPNPFGISSDNRSGLCNIDYSVKVETDVRIKVFNVRGELVSTLVNERKIPGKYTISWNGKNSRDRRVSSGVYFLRFETDNKLETGKIIYLK